MANDDDKQTLDLKIEHTNMEGDDPSVCTFPKTTNAGAAADQAAAKFGLTGPPNTFYFVFNGDTLERQRPLVSFQLEDGDLVTLTQVGVAV